ncbi:heat stress transcription factor A-9-like [Abrus precatorius]|uniref:Heat stress transcription factor A-9-like n=1 Tax=Abrus precatorius TaxID=3816 RepID=A0A8B8K5I3_ABRPR|nr:heat stress transcription factor A-9-like [Abrus precatorius]
MVVPHGKAPPIMEEEGKAKAEEVDNAGCENDDVLVESPKGIVVGPAAFLKKTFDMVEDPNTDPIVSWGEGRYSFVVWDSQKFSKTLLPKYFKHTNFSSFIRQLNTYGFRKVDSKRWEFANEGFQGGKKYLLKHIRRRSKCNKAFDSMKLGLEDEVEQLKKDQKMLKVEILKLTQKHKDSQVQLASVEERVRCAELKQFQMLVFLTRMTKRPAFVEQLMHKVKQKGELDGAGMVKRPKLDTTDVDYGHQGCEQLNTLQSEQNGPLENVSCSSVHELRPIGYDVSYAYDVMSDKLMGESSGVGEEVDVKGSNIYFELEDLISKPAD